ncbi:hypothetical protein CERSUDRAFT_118869 [Gelatoporia subvermispora B]|uniref:DUF6699 domain-containing protein n=1 Tax=Ceriporiopsis subvermispora (strain B) TaxID=914234 RepID=M2R038_CERS8|nr:hypothetical protein CERSUDRAFT_118869 [Gelatoporia subvermispora B]
MPPRHVRFVHPDGPESPAAASTSSGRSAGIPVLPPPTRALLARSTARDTVSKPPPSSLPNQPSSASASSWSSPQKVPASPSPERGTPPDRDNSLPDLAFRPLSPLPKLPLVTRHRINRILATPLEQRIQWDMRFKDPEGLSLDILSVAATNPEVPTFCLYIPSLPEEQYVVVTPYDKGPQWGPEVLSYVTLGDVFVRLADHVRVKLTPGALRRMGGRRADEVAAVCRRRCAHPESAGKSHDPRRVDCLGGEYVFDGIVPSDDHVADKAPQGSGPVYTIKLTTAL